MAAKKAQHDTRARAGKLRKQIFNAKLSKTNRKQGSFENSSAPKSNKSNKSNKNNKTQIITQEIKLARLLANSDKRIRDKVLKYLRKWLTVRAKSSLAFTEKDFLRLWKGLFYCMWMSDKLLIQEELAESLSKLVHCFHTCRDIFLYTACALQTLALEWYGIDQYRIDKFSMLTRRIIRQTLQICKEKSSWKMLWMKEFSRIIQEILLNPKTCTGFNMHIIEVFMEELAKIGTGNISEEIVTVLIKPFTEYLVTLDDEKQIKHIMKHVFRYLIFQSDVGIEYTEKFAAWRQAGFPAGHIDAMEKHEISNEENFPSPMPSDDSGGDAEESLRDSHGERADNEEDATTEPLDPRAGRVDVVLPQIPFAPEQIVDLLTLYKFHPSSTTKSRRQILRLIKEFSELAKGNMPLGIKSVSLPDKKRAKTETRAAALRFLKFQEELHSDKSTRKRKRKAADKQLSEHETDAEEEEYDNDDDDHADDEYNSDDGGDGGDGGDDGDNGDGSDEDEEESYSKEMSSPLKKSNTALNYREKITVDSNVGDDGLLGRKKEAEFLATHMVKKSRNIKQDEIRRNDLYEESGTGHCEKRIKAKKTVRAVMKKRLGISKIPGGWDVSENLGLPTQIPGAVNSGGSGASNSPAVNGMPRDDQAAWLVPTLKKLEGKKSLRGRESNEHTGQDSRKRVKIVLQKNTAQHTSEYIQKLRQSPGIPFDADKKPPAGVLKASPIPSPINPFYKKQLK